MPSVKSGFGGVKILISILYNLVFSMYKNLIRCTHLDAIPT